MATAVCGSANEQLRAIVEVIQRELLRGDSRRLYLASTDTFPLLSRPKGRNSKDEELGRGRWETASPQGR
jgi:hypothetical protein